jgi:hypothetical protein
MNSYSWEQQWPFLQTLFFMHLLAAVVGGGLDWWGSGQWRQKMYGGATGVFEQDWQPDAIIRFTRMKDLALLIPMSLLAWCYFAWRVTNSR